MIGKELKQGYVRQIFLLTDGAVSNIKDVLRFIGSHTKTSRLHCIGIGSDCSSELITGAASKGKGYSCFITDDEEPEVKMIKLLEDSLTPVISEFKFKYDEDKIESVTPSPSSVPYLLKNDLAQFFFQFKGKLTAPFPIEFTYKNHLG